MSIFKELFKEGKTRLKLILIVVVMVIVIIVFVYHYRTSAVSTGGSASSLPGVSQTIQSVPGSTSLSPEYLSLLMKSNQAQAQQALKTGRSAIPTVINVPDQGIGTAQLTSTGSCQAFCDQFQTCGSCQNIKPCATLLNQMVNKGELSPDVAAALNQLIGSDISLGDFAASLNEFVKENRVTPEQAIRFQECYREAFDQLTADQLVEQWVSNNKILPNLAKSLYQLGASGRSPADYCTALKQYIGAGLITAQAQQLCGAYQRKYQIYSPNNLTDQLLASGQISPDTATHLKSLANASLSPADYKNTLDSLVQEGKLTPDQEQQLLAAYNRAQGIISPQIPVHGDFLKGLVASGKLSPDVVSQLKNLSDSNVPASEYAENLSRLVGENKIEPPALAQQLLAAYRQDHGDVKVTETDPNLAKIRRDQQQGELQAQEAALAKQQQDYETNLEQTAPQIGDQKTQAAADQTTQAAVDQATQAVADQTMSNAIQQQAQSLFSAWNSITPQTYVMVQQTSSQETQGSTNKAGAAAADNLQQGSASQQQTTSTGPMIKAGTIMFAVLDTAVNSDEPGPVMATMVSGRFKGTKLMGGLKTTPNGERVMLTFTMMIKDEWPENVTINAVAIDPDTAHTAIASDVDHHYLLRFGSVFASNFMSGYANAVSSSGATDVNSSGTTTTTHSVLSPRDEAIAALGPVGQAFSNLANQWVNTPPTVTVDSGVGVGILFQTDVKTPSFIKNEEVQKSG